MIRFLKREFRVIDVLKRKCNMVFDRGYDDNKIIEVDSHDETSYLKLSAIIRMKEEKYD